MLTSSSSVRFAERAGSLAVCGLSLCLSLASTGCSGPDANERAGADSGPDAPAVNLDPIAAPPLGQWAPLIGHGWELEPGKEGYWCKRLTVAEDIYVSSFRAIPQVGIHHITLGVDSGQAGAFRCTGFSVGNNLMFSTGAGGGQFDFPAGVAVKLTAGQSLLLNLHLYNTSPEPLGDTTTIEVIAMDPAAVQHEAALVLAGTMAISIPGPGQTTVHGGCALSSDTTLLSVGPHMHTLGIHQTVTAVPAAGTPTVVLDEPYNFDDQSYRPLNPPVLVPAGGQVLVDCTYQNDSTATVGFGESTNTEMCFAGLFHYPRMANGSVCTL